MSLVKPSHELRQHLGSGAFGDVYLGEDIIHGEVAVKVLRQLQGEPDAKWAARKHGLIEEGKNLIHAAHTNVVTVHYLTESDSEDAVHLVMELCRGGSLQVVFDGGPLRLTEVRKLATEVCLGLDALHARGMLHRDIKPGNILISQAGVAKIGDFGLVTDDLIMGYGSQAGYWDHLAFEIYHNGPTSIRSDIWALGMTLYRLIHGAEWYSRLPADPRAAIVDGGYANKLPWLPHVPDAWRRAIRKMMRDDRHARFQTVHDVMNALAALSSGPNWSCAVAPKEVRWEMESKGRRRIVVWSMHSKLKHEWKAWSEPLTPGGRHYHLGASAGPVSPSVAQRQLKELFLKCSS